MECNIRKVYNSQLGHNKEVGGIFKGIKSDQVCRNIPSRINGMQQMLNIVLPLLVVSVQFSFTNKNIYVHHIRYTIMMIFTSVSRLNSLNICVQYEYSFAGRTRCINNVTTFVVGTSFLDGALFRGVDIHFFFYLFIIKMFCRLLNNSRVSTVRVLVGEKLSDLCIRLRVYNYPIYLFLKC